MDTLAETERMDDIIEVLQFLLALIFVFVFAIGIVALVVQIASVLLDWRNVNPSTVIALISTVVDIVLYLFIVVELYRTIIAYVEGKNVVAAVIHAGLIAVTRQIITFKPASYEPVEGFIVAGSHAVVLAVLFLGFWIVHRPSIQQNVDEE